MSSLATSANQPKIIIIIIITIIIIRIIIIIIIIVVINKTIEPGRGPNMSALSSWFFAVSRGATGRGSGSGDKSNSSLKVGGASGVDVSVHGCVCLFM